MVSLTIVVIVLLVCVIGIISIALVVQTLQLEKTKQRLKALEARPKSLQPSITRIAELETKLIQGYEDKIDTSTSIFAKNLDDAGQKLSKQINTLTTHAVETELTAYQNTIKEARDAMADATDRIRQTIAHQQEELQSGFAKELAIQREAIVQKLETKLGDIVAGYITEALGSGVDMGTQVDAVIANLEAHKEEIKRDINNVI